MAIIKNIVIKEGAKGPYKQVEMESGERPNIFRFHSLYNDLGIGEEVEVMPDPKNPKYTIIVDPQKPAGSTPSYGGGGSYGGGTRDASIKAAQERKDESIAWFNATNAAIECRELPFSEENQKLIRDWRQWFLNEWNNKPPF